LLKPKTKISTFMFFIVALFLSIDILGYFYIKANLVSSHSKEQLILFSNIQRNSSDLLSKLLYKYSLQKDTLEKKHTEVLNYVEQHGVDVNLSDIHSRINQGLKNKPYNIYITDDNLIIKNTTLSSDYGFNLSFAKLQFDNHKKENRVGISAPIFETLSTKFNSYTDSYLPYPNHKKILQVSYTYDGIELQQNALQKLIDDESRIKDAKAYILFSDGYVGDFLFKSFKPYKPTLQEVKERINGGLELSNDLSDNQITYKRLTIDGVNDRYKAVYVVQKSPIFDDAQIIYSVVFDEDEYNKSLRNLNGFIFFLTLFGLLAIYAIFKIRFKEFLLHQNDIFVKHSIHEIKTPLSIITLNNQLRTKTFGEDEFSKEIDSAVKILTNSYDDMTFLMTNKSVAYKVELIDLNEFVGRRVEYFKDIAQSYGRDIRYSVNSECTIHISDIELTRLIDNNLSNAIKYSDLHSTIVVTLTKNILSFKTLGEAIEDSQKIFEKYVREVDSNGGFGLGLSIVKDITQKYKIGIRVESENGENVFSYTFGCEGEG
jgi:signal transduction histidine kinase